MTYDKRLTKSQRKQITSARRSIKRVEESGDRRSAERYLSSAKRGDNFWEPTYSQTPNFQGYSQPNFGL